MREYKGELVELDEAENCSCCGDDYPVKDTTMCPECIDFSYETFYGARFEVIRNNLSSKKQKKFDTMSKAKKIALVNKLITTGKMI